MFNVECSMLSEATIQHSEFNIRNFGLRYPTMQIFSGATGDNDLRRSEEDGGLQ
jgi:hypothetical protein